MQEFGVLKNPDIRSLELEQSHLMPELDGRMFRMLSGSEKAILYLSMKLAISSLMPDADFILLDNPTLHSDDLRRQLIRNYLLHFVPQKQIIILTNDRIFADLFPQAHRIDLTQP